MHDVQQRRRMQGYGRGNFMRRSASRSAAYSRGCITTRNPSIHVRSHDIHLYTTARQPVTQTTSPSRSFLLSNNFDASDRLVKRSDLDLPALSTANFPNTVHRATAISLQRSQPLAAKMLATLITRACQILFTTIVLGISISAVRWQVYGSAPATTSYNAFAGAFGLLVALIGLAGIWVSVVPELIMSAVDTVTSILLLAGGIVSIEHRPGAAYMTIC